MGWVFLKGGTYFLGRLARGDIILEGTYFL